MRKFLFLFLFCYSVNLLAQSTYNIGFIPRINLNQKLENGWKLNYKVESRVSTVQGNFRANSQFNTQYLLTDVSVIASKKTGLNNNIAGGYLLRFRDGATDQRFIQQFTLVKRYNSFRLSHRFATDQTIRKNSADVFRLRYRITSEIPLNGYAVDENEFYLKVNHEYLQALESGIYDLEIRLVPLLGYVFTDTNKIEWGIDYRINDFIHNNSKSNFWLTFNWFISI